MAPHGSKNWISSILVLQLVVDTGRFVCLSTNSGTPVTTAKLDLKPDLIASETFAIL